MERFNVPSQEIIDNAQWSNRQLPTVKKISLSVSARNSNASNRSTFNDAKISNKNTPILRSDEGNWRSRTTVKTRNVNPNQISNEEQEFTEWKTKIKNKFNDHKPQFPSDSTSNDIQSGLQELPFAAVPNNPFTTFDSLFN